MILVCGEALIDLLVGEPSPEGLPTEAVAGGSPFNVAVALARLGRPVSFLSTLSEDAFGAFLAARLAAAGVRRDWLQRRALPTTLSVVATGADGQPQYAFYEAGADRALTIADLPSSLPDDVNAIAAGSYALGVEPIAGALATLLRREAGRRAISLDPNVRPRVVGELESFRARFEALLACATIVKGSAEDVELFYGTRDLAAVARDWLERGPKLAVVTRGEHGPVAAFGGGIVERPTPRVDVADTVGAGDVFHAGLLAWLDAAGRLTPAEVAGLDRAALAAALDYASAAAALACTRRGADPPSAVEVRGFLQTGAFP
ncbi:MAG TPA: carbohydrate kinase [Microvirga sp.]|nr:carbohydrate kinase [Microvirga sp.]